MRRRARPDQARHLRIWSWTGRAPARRSASAARSCATTTRRPAAPASISSAARRRRPEEDRHRRASASAATTRRAAPSLEPRFAACIAWGAIWDYHAVWKRRVEAQFKRVALRARPSHHVDPRRRSLDEALERVGAVPPRRRRAEDALPVPARAWRGGRAGSLADAQALYDACGSRDKTLRVFSARKAARSTASATT